MLVVNLDNYFHKKLSYGISRIAATFYPNPVIVRFSDFKTNEYANLSLMQRQVIDNKIVSKKSGAIKKIAKKLIVKLKKAELERLKKAREVGNQ